MNGTQLIFLLLGAVSLFLFLRNIFSVVFSLENYNIHKKRLKQLQFNKKNDADLGELIDSATNPIMKYILPHFKLRKIKDIDVDLKLIGWDKYLNGEKYYALSILFKIIGTLLFLLFVNKSVFIAVIWAVSLFFGFDFLFKNSVKNKKEELLKQFPDFIRKVSGFISSGLTIENAFTSSLKYIDEEWRVIVTDFIVQSELNGITVALSKIKNSVPIFEVREFFGLVSLALDRTGDIKESFESHIDKILELQNEILLGKISRKEMMAIVIQAPLLLTNIVVFGLPTAYSMLTMSSM